MSDILRTFKRSPQEANGEGPPSSRTDADTSCCIASGEMHPSVSVIPFDPEEEVTLDQANSTHYRQSGSISTGDVHRPREVREGVAVRRGHPVKVEGRDSQNVYHAAFHQISGGNSHCRGQVTNSEQRELPRITRQEQGR